MVYVFLAEGFEEIEALTVVDVLRRADISVKTVGIGGSEIIGSHGITVKTDLKIEELKKEEITAVILPGGMPGAVNLKGSNALAEILLYANENAKILAAICAAPLVLGNLGLLNGRCATCYPGFEDQLIGAKTQNKKVCVDENIITASGPAAAIDFALMLVQKIKDTATANKIRKGMLLEV